MLKELFSPIRIGTLELPNRLVVSPMVTNFCDERGNATERFINYHEARAAGGWGLIMTENFVVADSGRGFTYVGGLHTDEVLPSHTRLCERVHAAGGRIFAQLIHCGRETTAAVSHAQPVAPSALPCPVNQEMPRELSVAEIGELVDQFGAAARRAQRAGYDGVEINGAHGYLVAQFMSAYSNKRVDAYGGSLWNRMRFVREIVAAIRERTGAEFPLVVRISAEEGMPGGRRVEDSCAVAAMLEEMGVDAIDVSMGVYGDDYTIPPMTTRRAWSTNLAAQIKQTVRIPVISVGRINDPHLANSVIRAGKADLISMGRGSLADPELPRKARAGDFAAVRGCVGCMQGCTGYLGRNEPIRCLVNPALGFEGAVQGLADSWSGTAVVVGGGPAGLEAARVLERRGAKVHLLERGRQLGGQFALAAVPPFKGELASYVSWARGELERLGVRVLLETQADVERIRALQPDVVVLATGSQPARPPIEGLDGAAVVTAAAVLRGEVVTGPRVAVLGGGMVGVETAAHLAVLGREVTVLEMTEQVAQRVNGAIRAELLQLLEEHGASVCTGVRVLRVGDGAVEYEKEGETVRLVADSVVLAAGAAPCDGLREPLEAAGFTVRVVGDACAPDDALGATRGGFQAALAIEEGVRVR